MEHNSPFVTLLLITLLALIVPFLANRIKIVTIPIVVGEILAGIIIGKSGFNLVEPTPTLNFLSEFGFALLMFLSGLEVNFDMLRSSGCTAEKFPLLRRPTTVAALYFLSTLTLAMLIGFGLSSFQLAKNPILLGLILSTTSLGIVVPMLKERDTTNTPYGQAILIAALISDFVTLLLLSTAIVAISQGFSPDLLLFVVLLAVFFLAISVSRWLNRIPGLSRMISELSHATAQIRVRGSLALMVMCVVLADTLGVEIILGAFLAGAIVSFASNKGHESALHSKLDAIGYGFFIPIFFINVGAEFDLGSLLDSPSAILLVPILIIAAYAVKLIPALLYRRLFSWRESIALGVLLASRLSLIIAASAISLKLGLITSATNSSIILVAIITCTVSPLLFSRILPTQKTKRRENIVILGTDQFAILIGQRLIGSGEKITYIGQNLDQLKDFSNNNFESVKGNPTDETVLENAGLKDARAVIALSNSPETVLEVCRLAVEKFGVPIVIARSDNPQTIQKLQEMKIHVIQTAIAAALAIEGALQFPAAFAMLTDKKDNVDLADVKISNKYYHGLSLRKTRLPGDALVIGIQRQGEMVVPHGDTVLKRGDVLVLIGSPQSLHEAQRLLNE